MVCRFHTWHLLPSRILCYGLGTMIIRQLSHGGYLNFESRSPICECILVAFPLCESVYSVVLASASSPIRGRCTCLWYVSSVINAGMLTCLAGTCPGTNAWNCLTILAFFSHRSFSTAHARLGSKKGVGGNVCFVALHNEPLNLLIQFFHISPILTVRTYLADRDLFQLGMRLWGGSMNMAS